ncbi:hypothetical protein [Psychromarinibacter sp. S121]|uniref:hypothetical protein n=1 Tax=Psychromarinibacter sp. S121 TaxID=3415127 RepID=UPI003C7C0B0D
MILFVFLAIGVVAYLWWKRTHTTLTRDCRWRQDKPAGDWHCVACGARTVPPEGQSPRNCLRSARAG